MYTITLYKSRQGQNKRKQTKKSTVQSVHIHTDELRTQQITALRKKTQAPCCLYCRIFFSLWTFERNNKFSFSLFPSIVTLRRFNQHTIIGHLCSACSNTLLIHTAYFNQNHHSERSYKQNCVFLDFAQIIYYFRNGLIYLICIDFNNDDEHR